MSAFRVQLVALVILIAGLVSACLLTIELSSSAGQNQLVYTDRAEEGMTREEAIGIASGAFRGLVVNWLWLRANDLKQEGKFHEAVDLAKTITKLQPRFPRVWAFHGWNLAYNISVATQTPEERWQWVNAGIRLLRDEGIRANPNDLLLHKELSWIFLHKIQQMMDDSNGYYKRALAREWTVVLGVPPILPDLAKASAEGKDLAKERTPEAAIKRMTDWLERIAKAPETIEQVIEEDAKAAEEAKREPRAAILLDQIKKLGYDVATNDGRVRLLTTVEEFRSATMRMNATERGGSLTNADMKLVAVLAAPDNFYSLGFIVRHLRKRVLVDGYNMEPQRMIRYTIKYGPMDWRHAASHAVYWSARGVEATLDRLNDGNSKNSDFINTDRNTIQAVQELYRSGLLFYDILVPAQYMQMPNPNFIESYGSILNEVINREAQQYLTEKGVDVQERVWGFYRAGYENFLHDAIVYLYRTGDFERAKKYQVELASWPGRVRNDIDQDRVRTLPLEEFVVEIVKDRVTSPNIALQEIIGSLYGAYVNGLLSNDQELFRRQFEYARTFHAKFSEEQKRKTAAAGETDRMLSQISGKFEEVASRMLVSLLLQLPRTEQTLLYRRSPTDLQAYAYYVLENNVRPRDEQGNPIESEFDYLFSPPAGYDVFKRTMDAQRGKAPAKAPIELK